MIQNCLLKKVSKICIHTIFYFYFKGKTSENQKFDFLTKIYKIRKKPINAKLFASMMSTNFVQYSF